MIAAHLDIAQRSLIIAFRNLARQYKRSGAALLAISFGVAALLISNGFVEGMFFKFRETTIRSRFGHVQVTRPGFHETGRSDPYRYLLPNDFGTISKHVPAGSVVAPRLLVNGLVSVGDATLPFLGEGVDPSRDLTDDKSISIQSGRRLQPGDKHHIVIGNGLALLLGVKVGEKAVLLANTPKGQLGAVEGEVVGIFTSVSKEFDDGALLIPLPLARELAYVKGAHQWLVFLQHTSDTEQVLAELRASLTPHEYEVRPWYTLAEFYIRAEALFDQQLLVVKVIVISIILLGIGNTMMTIVMERTGEIGTMMALGYRRSSILKGFIIEGALLGLMGALIGLVLALLAAIIINALQINMPPPPGMTGGYIAYIILSPSDILEAVTAGCITATLATVYPASRASKLILVDAIRAYR